MNKRNSLIIVESPAKIKTITKLLGASVKVLSTKGHVKDLPEKSVGIELGKHEIIFTYVPLEKKEAVLKEICKAAQRADTIFLGPDPDREGEIIAWHVEQELLAEGIKPSAIKRITFNEITKTALLQAIEHPGSVDIAKVHAQQARRALDRWVGYEVSPILSRKFRKGLSAGRVQSVALRLICDRETAIKQFVPEESWSIEATGTAGKAQFPLTVTHINKKKIALKKEGPAREAATQLGKASCTITTITDTTRSRKPAAPFITSTLQQAAAQQLNFKVSKTMEIAQKLYEGIPLEDAQNPVALITYMRTDSPRIAESALKEVRTYITKTYGEKYLPTKAHLYSARKKGQDAHEAIRPVDISITPDMVVPYVDGPTGKLYTLIWRRFVACQMSEALFAQRKVTVEGGGFMLSATGTTPIFDGFLKLYAPPEEEAEKTTVLPESLAEGQSVTLSNITPKQHFTQPPARFSEASLVKELEKEGIGRPSTYATILKTIQARAYTELDERKRFVPTELGMMITSILVEHLPKIMNISFTAEMETELDKIAHKEQDRDELLRSFYKSFSADVRTFKKELGAKAPETTDIDCPSCHQAKLVIRFGKAGPFVGCARYPECSFTSNFKRNEDGTIELVASETPTLLETKCPQCGKPLRQVIGRFGPFIACSGYPDCTYIYQEVAPFPCPNCGREIVKRTWRGKVFWGCKGYPDCKFSISGEIEPTSCPRCKSPYLRKLITKDGITLKCPSKDCGYSTKMK